jgi:hypothetical protein
VVVESLFGNSVDFGVSGGQFGVKRIDRWMWYEGASITIAKMEVQFCRLRVRDSPLWIPNKKIATHRSVCNHSSDAGLTTTETLMKTEKRMWPLERGLAVCGVRLIPF